MCVVWVLSSHGNNGVGLLLLTSNGDNGVGKASVCIQHAHGVYYFDAMNAGEAYICIQHPHAAYYFDAMNPGKAFSLHPTPTQCLFV